MSLRLGFIKIIVTIFKDFSWTTSDFQEINLLSQIVQKSTFQQDFKDWTVVSTNYPIFFNFNYLK